MSLGKRRQVDYQKAGAQNPYFKQSQPSRHSKKLGLLFVVLAVIGLLYYLSTSEVFSIQSVQVVDNQYIDSSEVENLVNQQVGERRWGLFNQNNILFFNFRQLKSTINNMFVLESLSVKRDFIDRTIKVRLTEKQSGVVWVTQNENYYVDLTGVAVNKVRDANASQNSTTGTVVVRTKVSREGLAIIYDNDNRKVLIGSSVVSAEFINFLISLNRLIVDTTDVEVLKFEYESGSGKPFLIAQTLSGYDIFFNPDDSVNRQVNNLVAVLDNVISNPGSILYIDLRFGDKVIYK